MNRVYTLSNSLILSFCFEVENKWIRDIFITDSPRYSPENPICLLFFRSVYPAPFEPSHEST